MIFVTIGTQEPFDRLLIAIDEIAGLYPEIEFIAQTSNSAYKAINLKTVEFLEPIEFDKLFNEAQLILSHAGMGTILSALTRKKPILVVPRLVKYGEHRNEHQLATAKKMEKLGYIRVAYDTEMLKSQLVLMLQNEDIKPLQHLGNYASVELLDSLREITTQIK